MMQAQLNPIEVRPRLLAMRAENRHLRLRDAARDLGASEAALIAAFCGGPVVRLRPEWREILAALPSLGTVMALTRNEHAVIEKIGPFENVELQGHAGLVLGSAIDLRLFLDEWRMGFAVREDGELGLHQSLQFFDASGTAVHKVFLRQDSDAAAFDRLVARFAADDQTAGVEVAAVAPPAAEAADAAIDVAGLRAAWAAMQDTHDFVFLLRRFGVRRTQALRLAGGEWAERVPATSLRTVLEAAAAGDIPIMVFIGNRGAIEIHTGPVRNLRALGSWFNVLDDDFNLHVDESGLSGGWIVRKPTVDGLVTSVELYDAAGETVALLFGKRKPGEPERQDWRELVKLLPR